MIDSLREKLKIKTGIYGLAICFFVAYLNSGLFTIASGSGRPYMDMDEKAFLVNSVAFLMMWILFVCGKRENAIQSSVAIMLMALAHYFFISNVMSIF